MSNFLIGQLFFWIIFICLSVPLFIFYRFFFFFRDPKRKIPEGNNIVSPADGIVLYIKNIKDNEIPICIKNNNKIYLNELIESEIKFNLLIGIFMTPLSVHYNRFPFTGVFKKKYYKTGSNKSMLRSFLNIIFGIFPLESGGEYILQNERNVTIIESEEIKAAIVQIADKWIKKIVNIDFKKDDKVIKGQKLGLIRMGSQCDLFLKIDKNYKLKIKEKDYVKAGSSVLIELND